MGRRRTAGRTDASGTREQPFAVPLASSLIADRAPGSDWPHDLSDRSQGPGGVQGGPIRQPFPDVCMCLSVSAHCPCVVFPSPQTKPLRCTDGLVHDRCRLNFGRDVVRTGRAPRHAQSARPPRRHHGQRADPRRAASRGPRGLSLYPGLADVRPNDQAPNRGGPARRQPGLTTRCVPGRWHSTACHNTSGELRVAAQNRWVPCVSHLQTICRHGERLTRFRLRRWWLNTGFGGGESGYDCMTGWLTLAELQALPEALQPLLRRHRGRPSGHPPVPRRPTSRIPRC